LKLKGLSLKGNKKAKREKVLKALLKDRADVDIVAEDNGEGKTVDDVLIPELPIKDESEIVDTEAGQETGVKLMRN
jgi:hypothetical protein